MYNYDNFADTCRWPWRASRKICYFVI